MLELYVLRAEKYEGLVGSVIRPPPRAASLTAFASFSLQLIGKYKVA